MPSSLSVPPSPQDPFTPLNEGDGNSRDTTPDPPRPPWGTAMQVGQRHDTVPGRVAWASVLLLADTEADDGGAWARVGSSDGGDEA